MRLINEIILHCSDSEIGDVDMIREWHKERGWSDIGYHYVILKNGTVQKGREISIEGAHCWGHNRHSVGICLIGVNTFTQRQFDALMDLIVVIDKEHEISSVVGHNHYDKTKTCPNFDVRKFLMRFMMKLSINKNR